ncbi:hypothetical protein KSMBR1_0762 [Candidatus Kuenenia stuttgartiensis]|uniref:CMP/dCMP-type deaminase domain-containing protein n=2 Tax=Candidatus Brocadiaceae TaxID=1127830 RepID=A0A2C9CCG6_KUEST|nr:hypothetical protein KSMBR1_0762 [Candidatus Kuenenia stuttgartiensis]
MRRNSIREEEFLTIMKETTCEKWMCLAINKAKEGILDGQTPFGACIIKNNRLISCVHNHVWKNTDITAHAEIIAIREACKILNTVDLSGCTIYSTCEPCPMCFSACHWARIAKIVYGASIKDALAIGFNELSISNEAMKKNGGSPVEIKGNVLPKENIALFALWLKQQNRRIY